MKVRKAVLPAAGLGTRFLPATKTVPKEMLPLVDKPILFYIVEEIVRSGIEELILIEGRHKHAIADFFDTAYELEDVLEKTGKLDLLKPTQELLKNITVISLRQHQALGLGHAVLCAEPAVGREPFALLLGDEVMITPPNERPAIGQLMDLAQSTGLSTVAVMQVPREEVSKYGIVAASERAKNVWTIHSVVEKPLSHEAPSLLALPGRYVFSAELFGDLRQTQPGRNGEIQLTDAMTKLAQRQGLVGTLLKAERFDAGDKLGFLIANIELGLRHPEIGEKLNGYLHQRFKG